MKKIISIIVVLFIIIMGYNNFSFEKNMEEGKQAIKNEKFTEAKKLFEAAVDKKSDSREALALYKQTDKLIEVIELEKDGYYEEAMDLCQNINNIHSEDNLIQTLANNLKNEYIEKLQEVSQYEDNLNARLTEGKALVASFDYESAKTIFTEIIEEIKNTEIYYLQLAEAQEYLSICEGN